MGCSIRPAPLLTEEIHMTLARYSEAIVELHRMKQPCARSLLRYALVRAGDRAQATSVLPAFVADFTAGALRCVLAGGPVGQPAQPAMLQMHDYSTNTIQVCLIVLRRHHTLKKNLLR